MSGRRLLVLGIDGATFDVIRPLVDAGRLPHLGRLMREGAWGPLRSTTHPLTPQAWASFVTGTNPGKHGIFDFGQRAEGSYRLDLASGATRMRPGFWNALPDSTVGLLNIPLSYPPERVNGFMVTGMHTPTIDRGTFPADLYRDLTAAVPDYRIDVMCHWYERTEAFLSDVYAMMDARLKAALWLYERFRPDVFCPVFVGVDRVQHALWGRFQHGADDPAGREVARVYLKMDELVGELLSAVGDETNVIVMSDHGFGDLKKDVYLNRFLLDAGYLCFDPAKVRTYMPPERPATDDPRHSWYHRLFAAGGALPDDDEALREGRMPHRYRSFDTVDWSRTVAYAHGLFGNVYVNVHGREPEGCVPRGREYERVRRQVADDLAKLVDPEDGRPIVDRVIPREEVYWGPTFDRAPDLLVVMRNYSYMTRGACEFAGDALVSEPVVNHTGNHRLDGILIARGPDLAEGGKPVAGARIEDLAPTICHLKQAAVPADHDGQVIEKICNITFLQKNEVRRGERPVSAAEAGPEGAFDGEESEAVRDRLRSLGYFA